MTTAECPSCHTVVEVPDGWTADTEVAQAPGSPNIPHASVWALHEIGPELLLHECFYGTPSPRPEPRTRPNGTFPLLGRAFHNAGGDTDRLEATLFPPNQ